MEVKPWKDIIYRRFKNKGHPLVVTENTVVPAATLLTGAYQLVTALRGAGAKPGQRLLIHLTKGENFIFALLAGLWQDLGIIVANASQSVAVAVEETQPHYVISNSYIGDYEKLPVIPGPGLYRANHPLSPSEFRLLLKTSGTTSGGRWVALPDASLRRNLFDHIDALRVSEDSVQLSVLPWHHSFGLVLDLMVGLFAGAAMIIDGDAANDVNLAQARINEFKVNYISATPLFWQRMIAFSDRALPAVEEGLVGGAAISQALARELRGSNLRVGYGQTEAGPGICIGQPGEFTESTIGWPLSCEVKIDKEELHFRGDNAFSGYWNGREIVDPPAEWVNTGDLVELKENNLYYRGRRANRFKLSNGRWLNGDQYEEKLYRSLQKRVALIAGGDGSFNMVIPGSIKVAEAAELLGGLQAYCSEIIQWPANELPLTPKGDINKKVLLNNQEKTHGIHQA